MHSVFLFAHQDDEFGVFKVIEDLSDDLKDASFVYMTSGTDDGQVSDVRNGESRNVLAKLGVQQEQIHFLGGSCGLADGVLSHNLFEADQALTELFVRIGTPDALYIHAWEGGHQDHDAVHILGLAQALKHGCLPKTWQFSLYNGYGVPWVLYRVLNPLKENGKTFCARMSWNERWRYLGYCCSYPSQYKSWLGLLPFVIVEYLISGHQKLQDCGLDNIREAPHDGTLLYEARNVLTYDKFRDSVRGFVREKIFTDIRVDSAI